MSGNSPRLPPFHWLTVLTLFALSAHCSAGYAIANISAASLYVDPTDPHKDAIYTKQVGHSNTWEVFLNQKLDAETDQSVTINLKRKSTLNSSEQKYALTIQILDVNEFAPQFKETDKSISISESAEIGTLVCTVEAADPDSPPVSVQIGYNIIGGDDGYFQIPNKYNGSVLLVKLLDYESGKILFVLNISATELTSDGKTSYTTVTIHVSDEDDMMPVFLDKHYTLSIPEGNYTRTAWFETTPHLAARDGDHHLNQTIYFRIGEGSQYKDLFSVADNGSIAAHGFLTSGTYSVLVEAYQADKPSLRYVSTLVTITVPDGNDHVPKMSNSSYSASVSEDARSGAVVLLVSAVDEDVGNNSVIAFHLDNSASGLFDVETYGHIGIITLTGSLDREKKATYTFQVWAEETLTKNQQPSNKSTVSIRVLDVNDNSPIFDKLSYMFNLTLMNHKGDPIGQVSANDSDANENGQVTYSIPSSFPLVGINRSTGHLSLTRNLGESDVGTYDLMVMATDGATDPTQRRSSYAQVTIKILPVNSHPPDFEKFVYTFDVPETALTGFLVGKVVASDKDSDAVKYFVTESFSKNKSLTVIDQYWDHTGVENSEIRARAAFPKVKRVQAVENVSETSRRVGFKSCLVFPSNHKQCVNLCNTSALFVCRTLHCKI